MKYSLTKQKKTILRYLLQGMSNQEIAEAMQRSIRTVKMHLARMFQIFNIQSRNKRVSLAVEASKAIKNGELEL